MEKESLSLKLILPIALMLFSFFFGAGNFIFPPILGQQAGDNMLAAIIGFCISGVGLPLTGVIAMALTRGDNPETMVNPVHPLYAKALIIITSLTIGPFFAIPRTAAVSFDTGILAFIPNGWESNALMIYSFLFFAVTYFLSVNPSKIIDNIGKILTPMLLVCLGILITFVIFSPMGAVQPAHGDYASIPFFKGFQEGYNTMDLLASLLFGAATINAIEAKGVLNQKVLTKMCIYSGIIAALFLAVIYGSLTYMGASSVSLMGLMGNGGQLLSNITIHYFGWYGKVILALIIFFACLTTSIGVTSSVSGYFNVVFKERIQYDRYVAAICLFSFVVSNVGLSKLIQFAIPVLCILYPITIVIVLLNLGNAIFHRDPKIYRPCMFFTTIFAIFDGLRASGTDIGFVGELLSTYIPLYNIGFGWITPCLVGIIVGMIWKATAKK
ncbi:MAG: branched-chain amino acid transport system II carrier protein [Phascolarctobacterium sp.]|nr:branched-chain amino acid transport system II carrier protein [Phascolarctobacterium sp.]